MSPAQGPRGMILVPSPALSLQDSVQPSETTLGHLDFGSFQIIHSDIRDLAPFKACHLKPVWSLPWACVLMGNGAAAG